MPLSAFGQTVTYPAGRGAGRIVHGGRAGLEVIGDGAWLV